VTKLWGDFETYGDVPITNGTHAYAAGAEITIFTWAVDDAPVQAWDLTTDAPAPSELDDALADERVEIVFHNSFFDRTMLRHAKRDPRLASAYAHALEPDRWYDTMAQAMTHGLPGALMDLCDILQVPTDKAKDRDGKRLIHLLTKPQKDGRRNTRHTHPQEWARFIEYAILDVEAMRAVYNKLPQWNYRGRELDLWRLDQRINDRGFCVDVDLTRAAVQAIELEQAALRGQTVALTDGAVDSATRVDMMLKHILAEYGVDLPDMQKATLERRVNDPDLPWALRELLAVRLEVATTSASKYKTLLKSVAKDGRLHGTLQFSGAQRTRRWSGRMFQPQNMSRPTMKAEQIETDIAAFKAGIADLVCKSVMESASNAVRGCIVASPRKKIVAADLANIEGRKLAWLAGEQWKLNAYRAYDRIIGYDAKGKALRAGPDLYNVAYARSFAIEADQVTGDQRQIGKVMELALGYEGGVGAFLTFALLYRIDLEDLADKALPTIPADVLEEAQRAWEWACRKKRTYGLSQRAYVACDALKRLWRRAHPRVEALWKDTKEATIAATLNPGMRYAAGPFLVQRDGSWLRIKLPSGNYLCYPFPAVSESGQFSYMGVNQYTRKWSRIKSYGGKLVENATQGMARDVLAWNMPAVEAAGYEIVLSVHDELITEAPDSDDFGSDQLVGLMSVVPPWAEGLPLAAAGFEAYRYRKG